MIGLITVNYNQYKLTYEFLESLKTVKGAKNIAVYIADISSKKEDFKISKYPMKVVLKQLLNKGYAYSINEGIKYFINKNIKQFCAINNDIYFDKNFYLEAEKTFEKADIFGGKIYYAPGYEYHKNRYKKKDLGKVFWYAGGSIDWNHVYCHHRGVDEVDKGQYDNFEKTDFITGCMLFFNKKVIEKIGFWDEKYFLYFEDTDFCERAKRAGFSLYYNPKIIIYHKVSQSTGGSGSSIHQRYQEKNKVIFGLKYAPLKTKIHLLKNYVFKKIFKK
ncbi:MAG: glycosyltransferase family 2 protein [Patescibacteria group bacterium]|nr:glycosyltransferase family 2 protein [Patescibacteria group bacterium]